MAITRRDTPTALASPTLPVADPCVLVIFGATGDLAKRKLLPALYNLSGEGCLVDRFLVLGTGRSQLDDDAFRAAMRAGWHSPETRDTLRTSSGSIWHRA